MSLVHIPTRVSRQTSHLLVVWSHLHLAVYCALILRHIVFDWLRPFCNGDLTAHLPDSQPIVCLHVPGELDDDRCVARTRRQKTEGSRHRLEAQYH